MAGEVRAQLQLHERVGLGASFGVFGRTDAKPTLRDAALELGVRLVARPTLVVQATPGLTLPLAGRPSGTDVLVLTTGSVDPTAAVDTVYGATWLLIGGIRGRVPLVPGTDGIRQGAFGRVDLRVGRRISGGAVTAGLSGAVQADRGFQAPGFRELAVTTTAMVPISKTFGADVGIRVPVATDPQTYRVALRVGLTAVTRLKRKHD